HLRQTEFGGSGGDAVMAGERHFEAATERRSMDGGDDGLWARLDAIAQLRQLQAGTRLAEFGNVGAREKGSSPARDDDRADGCIVGCVRKCVPEPVAYGAAERIDRRIVDRDARHPGVFGYGNDQRSSPY